MIFKANQLLSHLRFYPASLNWTSLAHSRKMSHRSYKDAIQCLNSLQSNAATLEALRASGGRSSALAIPEMLEYLRRIGYAPEQLNALNVIHITGTKGKGSTSSFTDSILRHAMPGWKIGLYTSPHLVAVRERIRINGTPISEDEFALYFFQVWDKLNQTDQANLGERNMPGYFRFLTLMAFHTFIELKVDATVLEVGVGGTYDSTNIVPAPVVTGITALGLDHVNVLGTTLEEIAWQKGGIYKENVPALTVEQPKEAIDVLKRRAIELKASEFISVPSTPGLSDIVLGLAGSHQYQNANLAVHLARTFLKSNLSYSDGNPLPDSFVIGLQNARWPGRCQTIKDPNRHGLAWYLDGAHTLESLDCCMQWFVSPSVGLADSPEQRCMIFNCTSGRSGYSLLEVMKNRLLERIKLYGQAEGLESFFDHVIFCTNITYADGNFKSDLSTTTITDVDRLELRTQQQLASAWSSLFPSFAPSNIHVLPSIEHAVKKVELLTSQTTDPTKVLVTGSLHLVGGVIEVAGLSSLTL